MDFDSVVLDGDSGSGEGILHLVPGPTDGHAGCVHGVFPGVRHQSPDVSVSHLAAGCPRRGAHGGIGDPGRRSAEDGNVRIYSICTAVLSRCRHAPPGALLDDLLIDRRHHLRGAGFAHAEGYEEAGGVFLGEPPGLLHAGNLRADATRLERVSAAADQSRYLHRRAVLDCGHSVRTASHTRDLRVWWDFQRYAAVRHNHDDHVSVVDGIAAAEWIRGRIHHPAGHVHGELEMGGMGGAGSDSRGGLPAVAISACVLRYGHESEEREAARPNASRSGHFCPAGNYGFLDWTVSEAVFRDLGAAREPVGADGAA